MFLSIIIKIFVSMAVLILGMSVGMFLGGGNDPKEDIVVIYYKKDTHENKTKYN
ncbi:hypothetical protein [Fusobacterium periodonticum]|uniref:hypothetical protein n=1 Tax=Fusobacterium periodonticum TaxID=860 RepID=UPI0028D67106|nr:hypothetical protein [Fusobacterium periodonticum]